MASKRGKKRTEPSAAEEGYPSSDDGEGEPKRRPEVEAVPPPPPPDVWDIARERLPSQNTLPPPAAAPPGGVVWGWPEIVGYDRSRWYPFAHHQPFDAAAFGEEEVEDGATTVDYYGTGAREEMAGDVVVRQHDADDYVNDFEVEDLAPGDVFGYTLGAVHLNNGRPLSADLTMPYAGVPDEYISPVSRSVLMRVPVAATAFAADGYVLHFMMRRNRMDHVVAWVQGAIAAGWHDTTWKRALFNGLAFPLAPQFVRDRVANMMCHPVTRAWMMAPDFWPLNLRAMNWHRDDKTETGEDVVLGPGGNTTGRKRPAPPITALDHPALVLRVDLLTACLLCNVPGSTALLTELLRGLRAHPPAGVFYGPDPCTVSMFRSAQNILQTCAPASWAAAQSRIQSKSLQQVAVDQIIMEGEAPWGPVARISRLATGIAPQGRPDARDCIGGAGLLWNIWDRQFAMTPKILAGVAYDWDPAHALYANLYSGHTLCGRLPLRPVLPVGPDVDALVARGAAAMGNAANAGPLRNALALWNSASTYFGEPPCIFDRAQGGEPLSPEFGATHVPEYIETKRARIPDPLGSASWPVVKPPVAPQSHVYPSMYTLLRAAGHMVSSVGDFPPKWRDTVDKVTVVHNMGDISSDVMRGRALLRGWYDGAAHRKPGKTSREWGTEVLSMVSARYHPAIACQLEAFFCGGAVDLYENMDKEGSPWGSRMRPWRRNRGWFVDAFLCISGVYITSMEDRIHALTMADTMFPRLIPRKRGGLPWEQLARFAAVFHIPPRPAEMPDLVSPLVTSVPGMYAWNMPAPPKQSPGPFWMPGNPGDGNAVFRTRGIDLPVINPRIGSFARAMTRVDDPGESSGLKVELMWQLCNAADGWRIQLNEKAKEVAGWHADLVIAQKRCDATKLEHAAAVNSLRVFDTRLSRVLHEWSHFVVEHPDLCESRLAAPIRDIISASRRATLSHMMRPLVAALPSHAEVSSLPEAQRPAAARLVELGQKLGGAASRYINGRQIVANAQEALVGQQGDVDFHKSVMAQVVAAYNERAAQMKADLAKRRTAFEAAKLDERVRAEVGDSLRDLVDAAIASSVEAAAAGVPST